MMDYSHIRNEALRQRAQYKNEQAVKKMLDWLNQGNNMRKIIMHDRDLERTNDLVVSNRIEIVYDEYTPNKVELYYVDQLGNRQEGGSFDLNAFMAHIDKFYQENF